MSKFLKDTLILTEEQKERFRQSPKSFPEPVIRLMKTMAEIHEQYDMNKESGN